MATTPHRPVSENAIKTWLPETDNQREAVRLQLRRILTSPLFSNSKRSANLLRFVVESLLDGRIDHLKERSLGVDVFQRDPDYDTNRDPVVRTTAVEIRKRIAQYYSSPERVNEIRILLPTGSYLPEFRLPAEWPPATHVTPTEVVETPEVAAAVRDPAPQLVKSFPWKWAAVGLAVLSFAALFTVGALLAGTTRSWSAPPKTALDRFWDPVLASSEPVLFLIGGAARAGTVERIAPVSVADLQRQEQVAFADATTMARITGVMIGKGKTFHFRQHRSAKLEDLREGPTVLIGAFNNDWTVRLVEQGRFYFASDLETHDNWIGDREHPLDRPWVVHQAKPYKEVIDDYAIVARILEPTTGHLVVTAAGVSKFGTAAAGEFLSDPKYMADALRSAPNGWEGKNIQIVLATKLVGESSGPPRVLASYFW